MAIDMGAHWRGRRVFGDLGTSARPAQAPCPSPVPYRSRHQHGCARGHAGPGRRAAFRRSSPGDLIAYFDDYSWRAFVALVWPALSRPARVPDPNQPITTTGDSRSYSRPTRRTGKRSSRWRAAVRIQQQCKRLDQRSIAIAMPDGKAWRLSARAGRQVRQRRTGRRRRPRLGPDRAERDLRALSRRL